MGKEKALQIILRVKEFTGNVINSEEACEFDRSLYENCKEAIKWISTLSEGKKKTSEPPTKALPLHGVVQQRELLIAFAEHLDTDDPNEFQGIAYSKIVDDFLKSNL